MKLNISLRNGCYAFALAAMGILAGCQPDEVEGGNPLNGPELDASFSATSTEPTLEDGQTITVTANSTSDDIQYHIWAASNANGEYPSSGGQRGTTATFTFSQGGTYKIKHIVAGFVGGNLFTSEQEFNVELPLPEFGPNVVTSPNFEDASDWTSFQTSNEPGVNWTFNEGSATASGGTGNYPGRGIFQEVELEAGSYIVDMHAEGEGATDTWFEVYIGTSMPQEGADYTDGGIIIALNTWNGCGNTPFNGQLADLSCAGEGNPVTIADAGTYYLVVKTGSGAVDGINNITISDVSLRKINE